MFRTTFATILLIGLGLPALAAPPPAPAELQQLLQREPISAANWAAWSGRLREWSNEDFQPAFPAFQQAFEFVRKQSAKFPRNMDRDAVTWMVLAGASLHDSQRGKKLAAVGHDAAEAA